MKGKSWSVPFYPVDLAFTGAIGWGGSGNDIIRNGAGSQELHGEEGDDLLVAWKKVSPGGTAANDGEWRTTA